MGQCLSGAATSTGLQAMLWLLRWAAAELLVGYICLLGLLLNAIAYFRLARGTRKTKKPATLSTVSEGIISVVIPAYNEAATIGHTLRNLEATTTVRAFGVLRLAFCCGHAGRCVTTHDASLWCIAQDKQRVRIILVDAGCKDNTIEVVKASNCRISVK